MGGLETNAQSLLIRLYVRIPAEVVQNWLKRKSPFHIGTYKDFGKLKVYFYEPSRREQLAVLYIQASYNNHLVVSSLVLKIKQIF